MSRSKEAKRIRLPVVALNAIDRVYARIPPTGCKGLCHDECTVIGMTTLERDRIVAHVGRVPEQKTESCPLLSADKRCGVYAIRPSICRLWGAVEGLPCEHGCVPDGGLLSDDAAHEMFVELQRIDRDLYRERK